MPYIKFILIAFLLVPFFGFGAQFDTSQRITLDSTILQEKRTLQILLPENYQTNTSSTYPVTYLLDGDFNFHGVSGMLDMLSNKSELIPNVILVAIADNGTEKYREYMTPNNSNSPGRGSAGAADIFLNYLNNEVQPYINSHYRTAEHSTLVGHSVGGLFVLNSLLNAPESFKNYVAVSPSVWVSDNAIVSQANKLLGKTQHSPVSLYLSLGDEMQMHQYDFIHELDAKPIPNLNWHFQHYPDENHGSVILIALRDSLKHIFKGWHVSERILERNTPSATLDHYLTIQKELKIKQPIPASVFHIVIRQHYRQKNAEALPQFIAKAIKQSPVSKQTLLIKYASFVEHYESPSAALAILKKSESEFSHSIDYLKAIASTYSQLKDSEKTKKYYQKALELAKEQNVNQWQLNILKAKIH